MRNTDLRPRETDKRPPEELRHVLEKIYPEDMVDDLMKKLGMVGDKEES